MLYDIPGRTGTPIEYDSLCALAEHERILAVKDAKGDLFEGSRVMAGHRPRLLLRRRRDEPGLADPRRASASSASWVTCTAPTTPRWSRPSTAATSPRRSAIHRRLIPAVRAIMDKSSQGAIRAKAALQSAGLIPERTVRPPLLDATDDEVARLRDGPRGRPGRFVSHPHPELGPPPALPEGGLRVVALGGLGEVGRNMTVFEYDGRLLVVDCGVLFPEDFQPGVDLILPGLRLHPGPARRGRRHRADPRPRGPHRRRALPAARASLTSR